VGLRRCLFLALPRSAAPRTWQPRRSAACSVRTGLRVWQLSLSLRQRRMTDLQREKMIRSFPLTSVSRTAKPGLDSGNRAVFLGISAIRHRLLRNAPRTDPAVWGSLLQLPFWRDEVRINQQPQSSGSLRGPLLSSRTPILALSLPVEPAEWPASHRTPTIRAAITSIRTRRSPRQSTSTHVKLPSPARVSLMGRPRPDEVLLSPAVGRPAASGSAPKPARSGSSDDGE